MAGGAITKRILKITSAWPKINMQNTKKMLPKEILKLPLLGPKHFQRHSDSCLHLQPLPETKNEINNNHIYILYMPYVNVM